MRHYSTSSCTEASYTFDHSGPYVYFLFSSTIIFLKWSIENCMQDPRYGATRDLFCNVLEYIFSLLYIFFPHNSQIPFSLLGSVVFLSEFQKRILRVFSPCVLHSPTLNSFCYFITLLYETLHRHYSFPTLNDFVATENSAIHKMQINLN